MTRVPSEIALLAAVVMLFAPALQAADVSLRSSFDMASEQDVVVVTVPDTDVLVLDPGVYFSNGRRIVITALTARLDGETKIGFFPSDDFPAERVGVAPTGLPGKNGIHQNCGGSGCPADSGDVGNPGEPGEVGRSGSSMLIDIGSLKGTGHLQLVATGQAGGKGQKGGKGGTGGHGGTGAPRKCGAALGLDTVAGPGNGGAAGAGGPGGIGGQGGIGGAGGTITLSSTLINAVIAGTVQTELTAAKGGMGGNAGDPGDPGMRGERGKGASCGGHGDLGSENVAGPPGQIGPLGRSGTQGILRISPSMTLNESKASAGGAAVVAKEFTGKAVFTAPNDPKDCNQQFPFSGTFKLPEKSLPVAYLGVNVVGIEGIESFVLPPTVKPTINDATSVTIDGIVGRIRTTSAKLEYQEINPVQGVYIRVPIVRTDRDCTKMRLEVEYNLLTVPVGASMDAYLQPE